MRMRWNAFHHRNLRASHAVSSKTSKRSIKGESANRSDESAGFSAAPRALSMFLLILPNPRCYCGKLNGAVSLINYA
jgi:hypothetical protein